MDECHDRGVSVLAAGSYNLGLLARAWPADGAHFDCESAPPRLLAEARRLARSGSNYGVTLPQAVMQFPLRHPATSAVVIGLRNAGEVRSLIDRATRAIPTQAWEELDGPGSQPPPRGDKRIRAGRSDLLTPRRSRDAA